MFYKHVPRCSFPFSRFKSHLSIINIGFIIKRDQNREKGKGFYKKIARILLSYFCNHNIVVIIIGSQKRDQNGDLGKGFYKKIARIIVVIIL